MEDLIKVLNSKLIVDKMMIFYGEGFYLIFVYNKINKIYYA